MDRVRLASPIARRLCRRSMSTATPASSRYLGVADATDEATSSTLSLNPKRSAELAEIIRVDQAGEIAANWIYRGQMFFLGSDPAAGPLIQNMWDQEKKHLQVMDRMQIQHRVRPTVLREVAKVAGFGLGAVTALLGKDAAMACTEAVETVIGEHYDDQLKSLQSFPSDHPSVPLMKRVLEELRDDELEHLDAAVDHHSQRAPQHALLTAVVEAGCKAAIQICKRI